MSSLVPTARYICWRFKRDIDKLGPNHARDPFDMIFNRKKDKGDSEHGAGQNGGLELVTNPAYSASQPVGSIDCDTPDHEMMQSRSYHGTELRGVPEHDVQDGHTYGGSDGQHRASVPRIKDSGKEGSQMHSSALRSGALRAYSRPGGHMTSHLRV